MNKQETEDLYILSLDQKLAPADEERLLTTTLNGLLGLAIGVRCRG